MIIINPMRVAGLVFAVALSISVSGAPMAIASPAAPFVTNTPPTDQQLIDAIKPLTASGPPFTIVKVVSPQPDWYVVTINPTTYDQHSLVILQQATGPLAVVAGPGGHFAAISFPDAVHQYLTSVGAA